MLPDCFGDGFRVLKLGGAQVRAPVEIPEVDVAIDPGVGWSAAPTTAILLPLLVGGTGIGQ